MISICFCHYTQTPLGNGFLMIMIYITGQQNGRRPHVDGRVERCHRKQAGKLERLSLKMIQGSVVDIRFLNRFRSPNSRLSRLQDFYLSISPRTKLAGSQVRLSITVRQPPHRGLPIVSPHRGQRSLSRPTVPRQLLGHLKCLAL